MPVSSARPDAGDSSYATRIRLNICLLADRSAKISLNYKRDHDRSADHLLVSIQTSRKVPSHSWGRTGIPNLRIRYARVVRFIPSLAAAPFGPPVTQFDSFKARNT